MMRNDYGGHMEGPSGIHRTIPSDNRRVLHYALIIMVWIAVTAPLCFLLTKNAVEWEFGPNASPPEWCSADLIQLVYGAGLLGIIYTLTGLAAGIMLIISMVTRHPSVFLKAFCMANLSLAAMAFLVGLLTAGPAFSE
jgi:hypothetical protein